MYNRYIPQSDGSFRRDWMPDTPPERPAPPCPPKADNPKPPPGSQNSQHPHPPCSPATGIGGFFRQLIPRDFCTEDLLIVLLLLLMSGDSREDQNYALLTLALYLFL